MNITSIADAKVKASVITRFLAENNITLKQSNALHLLARLEGVDKWQALRSHLEAQSQPPGAPSILEDRSERVFDVRTGVEVTWHLSSYLTDRFGEIHDAGSGNGNERKLKAYLAGDAALYQRLIGQMWDECTFVARKSGTFGVLFEIGYECEESVGAEESCALDAESSKPRAGVIASLLESHKQMAARFPEVDFAVAPEQEFDGGPAVWAFVKDGALTESERNLLGRWLLGLEK